jgi:catechol 2,3-dioxygenase-like lactoylglutathione lyase family enzyme
VGFFQRSTQKELDMAINGVRFTHVAFRASDLERSIRWYEDAFGARKVFHAKQEGERPELLFLEFAKGQFVELFTNGKNKAQLPPDAIGYQHFCLQVDDLAQALQHLASVDVHPHRGPFAGRANYRIAFISDPDGNIIELMQIQPDSPIYRE